LNLPMTIAVMDATGIRNGTTGSNNSPPWETALHKAYPPVQNSMKPMTAGLTILNFAWNQQVGPGHILSFSKTGKIK